MSTIELYRSSLDKNICYLRANEVHVDERLASLASDTRRGISLVIPIWIDREIYADLVKEFSTIESDQYYYPYDDLHTTIFDFASASERHYLKLVLKTMSAIDRVPNTAPSCDSEPNFASRNASRRGWKHGAKGISRANA